MADTVKEQAGPLDEIARETRSTHTADVVVIGAGCAGLAAATALAEMGARVAVVEGAPRLGGRATAFSDPVTGERVDNGQHVVFGCYRETFRFLDRLGTTHLAPLQRNLVLAMIGPDGRRSDLSCPPWPPPWHLIGGVLRWNALSWSDRLRMLPIGRAISRARRVGPEAVAASVQPDVTVSDWLFRTGQSPRVRDWFWHPLTLAALNQSADIAAASPFIRVLGELFGPRTEDAAVALSTVPLDELYAEPSRRFIESRGGSVRLGEPATLTLGPGDSVAGVRTRTGFIAAPAVISTVPWFALRSLWDNRPPAALETIARNADAMQSSPIVTVNLWLDGPVLDVPFVGLVNSPVHWVFDKRQIVGGRANHLALVTSGADDLAASDNAIATDRAWNALKSVLPAAQDRRLLRSVVVRERRATFSLAPGGPARPATETPLAGFYLAGDWTDTGLPATIEGAVLSGHRAAKAVQERQPHHRRQTQDVPMTRWPADPMPR